MLTRMFSIVTSLLLAIAIAGSFAAEEKKPEPANALERFDQSVEEAKGTIEKAIGLKISGFFDSSYSYNTNRPSDHVSTLRVFDKDHNKAVFNDFNLTLEKDEKDWGVGFKLVGDFGRTAELLREATLWGKTLHDEPSAELREGFFTFTLPVGDGLQVKGGKFATLLGAEVIPTPGYPNPNFSRSVQFGFSIPFTHTGLLLTYPIMKTLSLSAGPVTGWDNPHDNNNAMTFLGGFNFTPTETFAWASSIVYGAEQMDRSGPKRFVISNVATIKPMPPLTLLLDYDYGHEQKATASGRSATWQGFAGIANYDFTEKCSLAFRAEVFQDRDGARTGTSQTLWGFTITPSYKITKMLIARAEYRGDTSSDDVFTKRHSVRDSQKIGRAHV